MPSGAVRLLAALPQQIGIELTRPTLGIHIARVRIHIVAVGFGWAIIFAGIDFDSMEK